MKKKSGYIFTLVELNSHLQNKSSLVPLLQHLPHIETNIFTSFLIIKRRQKS